MSVAATLSPSPAGVGIGDFEPREMAIAPGNLNHDNTLHVQLPILNMGFLLAARLTQVNSVPPSPAASVAAGFFN